MIAISCIWLFSQCSSPEQKADIMYKSNFCPINRQTTTDTMIADKLHLDYIFVSHSPINEFTSEEYIDFPALSTGSSNILENRNIPISR